jgi:hypothetical protein
LDFDEFLWRTIVLTAVNGVVMWLAVMLFDFGNARNKLWVAILWSLVVSALIHIAIWIDATDHQLLWVARIFGMLALTVFYIALFKWYDMTGGQTLAVSVATVFVDVAAYIALTEIGVLPPLPGGWG